MDEPPVFIFVMGENRWRHESEWPLARTHYTSYYFHADSPANTRRGAGTLSTALPQEEPPDSYVYDPADPVPTRGGNTLIIPQGVADQGPVEDRNDVLVYTSEPLEQELEITGPIKVRLFAASTAEDTDFTAKLVDVRPTDTPTTCKTASSEPVAGPRWRSPSPSSRDRFTSTKSTCGPPVTCCGPATGCGWKLPAVISHALTVILIPPPPWDGTASCGLQARPCTILQRIRPTSCCP